MVNAHTWLPGKKHQKDESRSAIQIGSNVRRPASEQDENN